MLPAEQERRTDASRSNLGRSSADHALIDAFPDAALLLSDDGRVLASNRAARQLFDHTGSDFTSCHIDELLTPSSSGGGSPAGVLSPTPASESPPRFRRMLGRTRQGQTFFCEAAVGARTGERDEAQWLVTVRNPANRDFHEFQLRESIKTAAVTSVIGRVANDFNNQLTAISGNLESAWRTIQERGGPGMRELAAAYEATRKAADLAWRLAGFATPPPTVLRVVDPTKVVRDCLAALQRDEAQKVSIRSEFNHEGWRIRADAAQIVEVLTNCCRNALEAMPEGGLLAVSTHRAVFASGDQPAVPEHPRGEFIRIDVTDTGHGIASKNLPHIFDPFFTTKGSAYGLGLAGVYGILRAHNGGMTVESTVGVGTTFHVYLPRTLDESEKTARTDTGTGETVLIVDDEAVVRRTTRAALEYCGFRVLEATDGDDGLAQWHAHRSDVALVILDVQMPGQSGWEVLTTLRRERPALPVILVSGYPGSDGRSPEELPTPDAFLRKPYEFSELVHTAQSLLRARKGSPQPE